MEAQKKSSTELCKLNIAGVNHYPGKEQLHLVKPGARLDAKPEPSNEYDPNAVELFHAGVKLGYVPGTHSQIIAALLANNIELSFVAVNQIQRGTKVGGIQFAIFMER